MVSSRVSAWLSALPMGVLMLVGSRAALFSSVSRCGVMPTTYAQDHSGPGLRVRVAHREVMLIVHDTCFRGLATEEGT